MPVEEIQVSKGIVEVSCATWLDFMTYIETKHNRTRGCLYRGERESTWDIEPTLLRAARNQLKLQYTDWSEDRLENLVVKSMSGSGGMIMQSYMTHFSLQTTTGITDIDLFQLGRHHGLLTPFIDWSRSPYVAAFFGAVDVVEHHQQKSNRFFSVYILSEWLFPWKLSKRSDDNSPLKRWALKVNAATLENKRGIAQRGVCTYLYPTTSIQKFVSETADDEELWHQALTRILLPHSVAEDALMHLHHMNINYTTLFPDQFGLVKQANLSLISKVEGLGNWLTPPGFSTLIPDKD